MVSSSTCHAVEVTKVCKNRRVRVGSIRPDALVFVVFFMGCILYEWTTGNYKNGKLGSVDFKMAGISVVFVSFFQKPLLVAFVFGTAPALFPFQGALGVLDQNHFWWALLGYLLLEEYLHGLGHWYAHTRTPERRWLRPLHKIFRTAHRPHHLIGKDDGKAQISVGQTYVEGWAYWLVMPNIWLFAIALFLGLHQVVVIGATIKTLWVLHVHTNWKYDLYFLNHPNPVIRKLAFGLAHIFTFPNQHHHHHARGSNSAKNMQNMLSLYDWLIYDTLKIETTAPEAYGWRQKEEEKHSALYRFTRTYQ